MRWTCLALLVACGNPPPPQPPAPVPTAAASAPSAKPAPPPPPPPCESVALAWAATLVPDPAVSQLAVSGEALFLASDEVVYVSRDDGASFDAHTLELPSLDPNAPPHVQSMAAVGSTLYVATDAHVLVGEDFGQTTRLAFAPTETVDGAIAPSPIAALVAVGDEVILVEKNGTLRSARDWQPLEGPDAIAGDTAAFAGNPEGYRYLVDQEALHASSGQAWSKRQLPAPRLAAGRGPAVMAFGDGVHRSTDGAASWTAVEAEGVTVVAGGRCPREWMIGTADGIALSRDEGATFAAEALSLGPDVDNGKDLRIVALWRGEKRGFGLGRVKVKKEDVPVLLLAQPR